MLDTLKQFNKKLVTNCDQLPEILKKHVTLE